MSGAYSMIVNGGYKIVPSMIEKIQDRNGKVIYQHDARKCIGCDIKSDHYLPHIEEYLPVIEENRELVTDPRSAYQLISILEGVVEHTQSGKAIKTLGRTLGGKTGTTNNNYDAWFIGFSPDLVVGTYVGFDDPKSLGKNEIGASVAQPIFVDFMKNALHNQKDVPFRIPNNIKLVKIDYMTGKPTISNNDTIYEAFKLGSEPSIIDSDHNVMQDNKQRNKILDNRSKNDEIRTLRQLY
jgi:penicillin-binding protein 1A